MGLTLSTCVNLCILFNFLKNILLFIHERERERPRHRQREKQAPWRKPNLGLDPGSPGSHPGLKAALNRWATRAAPKDSLLIEPFVKLLNLSVYFQLLGRKLVVNLLPSGPHIGQAQKKAGQFQLAWSCGGLNLLLRGELREEEETNNLEA